MRCSVALKRMSALARPGEMEAVPGLADHVASCAGCARAWREHAEIVAALDAPWPEPAFRDLTPQVMGRLGGTETRAQVAWRWAMAATLALAALGLGYLFGAQSTDGGTLAGGMESTYQEALTVVPPASSEGTYLDAGVPAPRTDSGREP